VRALHGDFSIHGTPGRGTMIEVTLPLPAQEAPASSVPAEASRPPRVTSA
jgi:hypothetical protein